MQPRANKLHKTPGLEVGYFHVLSHLNTNHEVFSSSIHQVTDTEFAPHKHSQRSWNESRSSAAGTLTSNMFTFCSKAGCDLKTAAVPAPAQARLGAVTTSH